MAKSSATSTEPFDDDLFETRLEALKDTQDGIQQMSNWCLQHRANHKKIIQCWLNVFKRVRVDHRLVLFYLANDVIQYSKRKRYEFVECWATALQRATTMVRDDRVKGKILRIFEIWEHRDIYNEEFLSDLSGLLNVATPKKSSASTDPTDEFQSSVIVARIRECVELADATDKSFKKLPKPPTFDIDVIKHQIKDKRHSCDIEKDVERCVAYINAYNKNLQNEIKSRILVLESLEAAKKFCEHQRGEVKVVASAYKNFGNRIKIVKRKLDEVIPTLASPIQSPDVNAPSPERDADLQLPDENNTPLSMNLFGGAINGFSSYMDGQLPFDINDFKRDTNGKSQPIEVIGSRSDDESYTPNANFYKPETLSSIPGLGPGGAQQTYGSPLPPPVQSLFAGGNHGQEYVPPPPPHISGYGGQQEHHPYTPAAPTNAMPPPPPMPPAIANTSGTDEFNSTWDMSMTWTPLDSHNSSSSSSYTPQTTPQSPPHFERKAHGSGTAPIEYSEQQHSNNVSLGTQDVDHRTLQLPPAFDFGAKLGLSKDKSRQLIDIDHRNLISLTGSPSGNEKDFSGTGGEDVDYRVTPAMGDEGISSMAPPGSYVKKTSSPLKSNASSSSESDRVDGSARYDPADMVVDMDMSDEDLDESLREANASQEELTDLSDDPANRPALLETPSEFLPPNVWDTSNNFLPQQQQQQPPEMSSPQPWAQAPPPPMPSPWNGGGGGGGNEPSGSPIPPPPRPPFGSPFPFQAPFSGGPPNGNSPENVRGRGRGRGWSSPYRQNFPRMQQPHGNGANFDSPQRPFFPRGGGGGGGGPMRGGRGRLRGNNAWM